MDVIICAKITPDPEDLETRPNGTISTDRAEWIIGNFDLQAIEAGVRLAEATGGKAIVLSAGPPAVNQSKLKKDLLSRGPDELYLVIDPSLADAETALTAEALARAVQKIGAADLVLCGEGSADLYFQQVGLQLGERLGYVTLNAVSRIETEGDQLLVERSLEDEIEMLEVPIPAALSVTTDINPPRLPTMKEILKAGKKPITEWSLADIGMNEIRAPQIELRGVNAPQQAQRKNVMITGSPDEAVQALLGHLAKEGLV